MQSPKELSPVSRLIRWGLVAVSVLGLTACVSKVEATPTIVNNLTSGQIDNICLDIANDFRQEFPQPTVDLKGSLFQSSCLTVLAEKNHGTTCSTGANARDVGRQTAWGISGLEGLTFLGTDSRGQGLTDTLAKLTEDACKRK